MIVGLPLGQTRRSRCTGGWGYWNSKETRPREWRMDQGTSGVEANIPPLQPLNFSYLSFCPLFGYLVFFVGNVQCNLSKLCNQTGASGLSRIGWSHCAFLFLGVECRTFLFAIMFRGKSEGAINSLIVMGSHGCLRQNEQVLPQDGVTIYKIHTDIVCRNLPSNPLRLSSTAP